MLTSALSTPADIVAAAPGVLGFAPTNSVVAYMLRRHITHGLLVRCAIRFDVTVSTEQAANLPATCNLHTRDNDAAILLVVCDARHDEHAAILLDALRDALHTAGIHVLRRVMTRDVTAEGRWLDPDSGESGATYPYTDSLLTAQRVHNGERVSPNRGDIEAEFDPIQPAAPVEIGDHGQLVSSTAQEIAAALAGNPITGPTLATRAGILITGDPARRDAMLSLAGPLITRNPPPTSGRTSPASCAANPAPKRSPWPPSASAYWATPCAPASPPTQQSMRPNAPTPRRPGWPGCS